MPRCRVVGAVADNCSVMKKMHTIQESLAASKYIGWGCLAHLAQLLTKDICEIWANIFTQVWTASTHDVSPPPLPLQACSIETLFRTSHYARGAYLEEMGRQQGQLLRQPVETRWGSKVDCLQSVIANRVTIENTLSRLRRERFEVCQFKTSTKYCVTRFEPFFI